MRLSLRSLPAHVLLPVLALLPCPASGTEDDFATPGTLEAFQEDGTLLDLPLRHTDVSVEISAFVARTTIEQVFVNPFDVPIEAVYTFPLGHDAAVDDFEMRSGTRVIRGEIHRREEARRIYEAAKVEGFQAALLEQERPNIFTQSVANLPPAGEIRVRIRTVEVLDYDAGTYQFTFPLVVGPRYIPGDWVEEFVYGPESTPSPVALPVEQRINPPTLPQDVRSGHDVDIRVSLEAGVPVGVVMSPSHAIEVEQDRPEAIRVALAPADRIPNKDFVLRWDVSSDTPNVGMLCHRDGVEGHFAFIVQPRGIVGIDHAAPKEILFVLDTSGSMSGTPIRMSKNFVRGALQTLGDRDTFNLIRFAGSSSTFSEESLDRSDSAIRRALRWVDKLEGHGGTEMLSGLKNAVDHAVDAGRFRMIVFLTDGYIGNETQILAAVEKLPDDVRVFTIGIGSSVNHHLLDGMARLGGGAYTFIPDDGDRETALEQFSSWVTRPYLTDLEIDWGALPVEDWIPEIPRDLFSGQNLTVVGRYFGAAEGSIVLRGTLGGSYWEHELPVVLPEVAQDHEALASVWARKRIEGLLDASPDKVSDEVREEVTDLALEHRLMSRYTSFVAVDYFEQVSPGGEMETVHQAVPLPEGTTFESVEASSADRIAGPAGVPVVGSSGLAVHVVDSNGLALPGAMVTLDHAWGNVRQTAELSDSAGMVEFPVLQPDSGYSIMVSFPGFAPIRYDGLRVENGKGLLLQVQMVEDFEERVMVTASRDVIDLERTESSTRFQDSFISDLPASGRFYQNVLTMAPGVQSADGDGNPNVHGSRARDFRTTVGGVSNVDPLTGQWLSTINPNSIVEMEVITSGAGVEFGRSQGGFARIIQKQGSNTHEGEISLLFGSDALDSAGGRDVSESYDGFRGEMQVSGPFVKDRLWYSASHEWIRQEDPVDTTGAIVVVPQEGTNHSDRLTWQVSPRNKVSFQGKWHTEEINRLGVSSLIRPEATARVERDDRVFSLVWTAPYSPRVLVDTVLAHQDVELDRRQVGAPAWNGCVSDDDPLLSGVECLDLVNGAISGTTHRLLDEDRRRLTLESKATIYGGRFWGMTHQLKIGVELGTERHDRTLTRNPSLIRSPLEGPVSVEGDLPSDAEIVLVRAGAPETVVWDAEAYNWGLFFEDQVKPVRNLTLTVGLRLDWENVDTVGLSPFVPEAELDRFVEEAGGSSLSERTDLAGSSFTAPADIESFLDGIRSQVGPELCCADPLVPPGSIVSPRRPEWFRLSDPNLSPSFTIAWSPWDNGKTSFSLGARRYHDELLPAYALAERDPATADLIVSGIPGQAGEPRFVLPSVQLIDRELETPYQDEWTFRFERELWAETRLEVRYVNRRYENQLQDVDVNHLPGDFGRCAGSSQSGQPTVVPIDDPSDPLFGIYANGGDGILDDCMGHWSVDGTTGSVIQTPDGIPDLYVQNPLWGDVVLIDNLNSGTYEGYTVEIVRRQYRGWQLQASYTYSESRGKSEEFAPLLGDERAILEDREGLESHDRRHDARIRATTITPWGIRIGGSVTWESGLPYSTLEQRIVFDAIPPALDGLTESTPRPRLVYISSSRNDRRNDSRLGLDLKVGKEIRIGRQVNLEWSIEALNLLDDRTYRVFSAERGYGRSINGHDDATRRFGRRFHLGFAMQF